MAKEKIQHQRLIKLQNCPSIESPTICIHIEDEEWVEAYENWLDGKHPTNSPEWKKGVFAIFEFYQSSKT